MKKSGKDVVVSGEVMKKIRRQNWLMVGAGLLVWVLLFGTLILNAGALFSREFIWNVGTAIGTLQESAVKTKIALNAEKIKRCNEREEGREACLEKIARKSSYVERDGFYSLVTLGFGSEAIERGFYYSEGSPRFGVMSSEHETEGNGYLERGVGDNWYYTEMVDGPVWYYEVHF